MAATRFFIDSERRPNMFWRTVLAVTAFAASLLAAVMVATALQTLLGLPDLARLVIGGPLVTAAAVGAVYALRRYVDGGPWRDVGVRLSPWAALPQLVAGLLVAAVAVVAATYVAVAVGLARFAERPDDTSYVAALAGTVVSAVLVQAFPEELVFRGYLFHNLSRRYPLWGAFLLTSAVFGSLHIVSQSGVSSFGERLVYVVMATGFGLLLTACRIAAGTIWVAVGAHAGVHLTHFFLVAVPTSASAFTGYTLISAASLGIGSGLVLAVHRWLRPAPRTYRAGQVSLR